MYASKEQIETYLKMGEVAQKMNNPINVYPETLIALCLEILESRRLKEHEQQGEENGTSRNSNPITGRA